MKNKKFFLGVTFYVTTEMNDRINKDADALQISKSEYIRKSIEHYQNAKSDDNSNKEQENHE